MEKDQKKFSNEFLVDLWSKLNFRANELVDDELVVNRNLTLLIHKEKSKDSNFSENLIRRAHA